ncbi:MAG: flagellar filament capping protein FliD [Thermodesulfobacteriota bacterium]|nr:flagellar filament capping protein FliD [Thermodesulfobacteriota bacterium]
MVQRLGGLVSGIDVNTIINNLLEARRIPITRLENIKDTLDIKKSVFQEVKFQLYNMQKSLLDLRLESTFKSKLVTSSDSSKVTATAGVNAANGLHTLEIERLAISAFVRSQYSNAKLASSPPNTAGIATVAGRPMDNLEGIHNITISDQTSYYKVESSFAPTGGGLMETLAGVAAESSTGEGTIGTTINSSSNQLKITIGGETVTITLDDATADVTAMAKVAADVEDKINSALNTSNDTSGLTYVAVRASRDATVSTDAFTIYDVKSGTTNDIVIDTGISNNSAAALGFGSGGTTGTAATITSQVTSSSLEMLLYKMNEPITGLIRGVEFFVTSSTGLTTGTAVIGAGAKLNNTPPTKTVIHGGTGVSTSSLNTTVSGLDNAGFTTAPSTSTNGTFTINGVSITISDYTSLSVNDVLGLINGSGAGVTASYDSTNDRFVLTSNTSGNNSISLSHYSDTSNFLTIANLTSQTGATQYYGGSGGTIDEDSSLLSAGFDITPTSGVFTINDVTIYVDASNNSIGDLIDKINNSNAKVTASYDSALGKFLLQSTQGVTDTNTDKIVIGSDTDTSNILFALNLMGDMYAETSGNAASGNRTSSDLITLTYDSDESTTGNVNIESTTGSGAYQGSPGVVNWIDGIANNAVFKVTAGTDGTTAYTWTNNSGLKIADIDTFVSEWNKTSNWSGGSVAVGVVKEGADQLRFFNRDVGANAEFTIRGDSPNDIFELGLTTNLNNSLILDSDTYALWHFGEGTGSTISDEGGNYNGTIGGSATWTTTDGIFGTALDFNSGTSDEVSISSMSIPDTGTMELWIKPDFNSNDGNAHPIFSNYTDDGDRFYIYFDGTDEKFKVNLGDAVTDDLVQSDTTSFAAGSGPEIHITVTFDYTNDSYELFVDGTSRATSNASRTAPTGTTSYIGSYHGATTDYFDGVIDEVKISNVVRGSSYIQDSSGSNSNDEGQKNITNGTSATASAKYNALTFAYNVNNDTDAAASVTTSGSGGDFTLTSRSRWHSGNFTISDYGDTGTTPNTVSDYFGASSLDVDFDSETQAGECGQDSQFTLDDVIYTRTTNAISDVIGSVTINLLNPTTSSITLEIKNDTDKAIEKLSNFIVEYNKSLEKLNPGTLSDDQKEYLVPLSSEDKASMTFTEIDTYNYYNELYTGYDFINKDSSIRQLYSYFRENTADEVRGIAQTVNSLADLNITSGSVGTEDDSKKGYLLLGPTGESDYLDTIRDTLENNKILIYHLENNADNVYTFFSNDASENSGTADGLARKLDEKVDDYIGTDGIISRKITTEGLIDKEIEDIEERIYTMEERLENDEERLWEKFGLMEMIISKMQAQSTFISALSNSQNNQNS